MEDLDSQTSTFVSSPSPKSVSRTESSSCVTSPRSSTQEIITNADATYKAELNKPLQLTNGLAQICTERWYCLIMKEGRDKLPKAFIPKNVHSCTIRWSQETWLQINGKCRVPAPCECNVHENCECNLNTEKLCLICNNPFKSEKSLAKTPNWDAEYIKVTNTSLSASYLLILQLTNIWNNNTLFCKNMITKVEAFFWFFN